MGVNFKICRGDILRDTLKAAAVTLGTSARLHPWLLNIYEKRGYEIYAKHENDDGDLES